MEKTVFIRQGQDGTYRWYFPGPAVAGARTGGEGDLTALQDALAEGRYRPWMLLPGERIGSATQPLVYRERRHLRDALPYQLEESLLGDVETLHFAFGEPVPAELPGEEDALVPVAWCDRDWLAQILKPLHDAGLELHHAVPEPLLLRRPVGWHCRLDGALHCHLGKGYGFSVDPAWGAEILGRLLQEQGVPEALYLSAPDEGQLGQLREMLPEALQDSGEACVQGPWDGLNAALAEADPGPELDLLQGEFARRLPLARWWRQCRGVAALALVALCAWLASQGIDIYHHQQQLARYQAGTETAFRSVVPAGVLVDAEKQLRHKLAGFGAGGDYQGPISLMARLGPLLAEDDAIRLRGLTYNAGQGEVRLNCHADAFTGIEQLRNRLLRAGLQAELVHSSADGQGQQARFRIAWGQL